MINYQKALTSLRYFATHCVVDTKTKKPFKWTRWQIEMDGTTPKIYLVDQEHCDHDYKFEKIVYTVSFPAGVPMCLMKCTKCGYERVTNL